MFPPHVESPNGDQVETPLQPPPSRSIQAPSVGSADPGGHSAGTRHMSTKHGRGRRLDRRCPARDTCTLAAMGKRSPLLGALVADRRSLAWRGRLIAAGHPVAESRRKEMCNPRSRRSSGLPGGHCPVGEVGKPRHRLHRFRMLDPWPANASGLPMSQAGCSWECRGCSGFCW